MGNTGEFSLKVSADVFSDAASSLLAKTHPTPAAARWRDLTTRLRQKSEQTDKTGDMLKASTT